jgi:transcriptional regulator with XRE-family HTH domain
MTAVQSEAVHAGRGNPGEILRQKRLALGWSQAQVAQNLNLSERIIEQLETGNYQQMPGHTFARGYTKAYGKLLGLDQVELVRTFDGYTGTDAKGSTVHSLGRLDEPVRLSRNVLRFVSFILVVLFIAMGLFWWQERSRQASTRAAPGCHPAIGPGRAVAGGHAHARHQCHRRHDHAERDAGTDASDRGERASHRRTSHYVVGQPNDRDGCVAYRG